MEFDSGAQLQGVIEFDATWAILIAKPSEAWEGTLTGAEGNLTTYEFTGMRLESPLDDSAFDFEQPRQPETQSVEPYQSTIASGPKWKSIYLEGDLSIEVTASAILAADAANANPMDLPWHPITPRHAYRPNLPLQSHDGFTLTNTAGPATFTIQGQLQNVEYHGMQHTCPSSCPPSASRDEQQLGESTTWTSTYAQIEATGTTTLHGSSWLFIAGHHGANITVAGHARLPGFQGEPCQECKLDGNQTLHVQGNFTLEHVGRNNARIQSGYHGDALLRIDETNIPPQSTTPTIVVGSILAVFGALLISKRLLSRPLRNQTRQDIHTTIKEQPGISFRQLQRHLDIANGNLHYHLFILENANLVASSNHYGKKTYQIQGHDHDLRQTSTLQNQHLQDLLDAIQALESMPITNARRQLQTTLGWAESTLRYRINRLIDVGLITIKDNQIRAN